MLVQPDQTGGLKSFPRELLSTLTTGLQYIAAGELQKRYGFSFGADDRVTVNTQGQAKPAAAPSPDPTPTEKAAFTLSNSPVAVAAVIAALVAIAVALVRR